MVTNRKMRAHDSKGIIASFPVPSKTSMAKFHVNGEPVDFRGSPDTPLLWVIRDHLGLTGTKYGCGVAQCGACTVHIGGEPARACMTPVSTVEGKRVITIEGVTATSQGKVARAVQAAW